MCIFECEQSFGLRPNRVWLYHFRRQPVFWGIINDSGETSRWKERRPQRHLGYWSVMQTLLWLSLQVRSLISRQHGAYAGNPANLRAGAESEREMLRRRGRGQRGPGLTDTGIEKICSRITGESLIFVTLLNYTETSELGLHRCGFT